MQWMQVLHCTACLCLNHLLHIAHFVNVIFCSERCMWLSYCRACKPHPECDFQLVLVVDKPTAQISQEEWQWLRQLQARWHHKVRIRNNSHNLGASATRNTALQVSMSLHCLTLMIC